jgi:integrase
VERADKQLVKDGLTTLPEGLTLHALRRTFASLLIAVGKDHAYVMRQMGHTSPTMTLGLYAQVMDVADANRKALRALVDGGYLAVAGSGDDLTATNSSVAEQGVGAKSTD